MIKRNFVVDFIMIQLVFGVQPVRFDVNRGPARRGLHSLNRLFKRESARESTPYLFCGLPVGSPAISDYQWVVRPYLAIPDYQWVVRQYLAIPDLIMT